ncbi:hypothetical protein DFH28DRAFT_929131 [Melampsora americana]|nr:hypothetical protein DFH28DRAFT_929131 [Melampsora americana]
MLPENQKKVTPEVATKLEELMKKAALKQTSAAEMRVVAKKYSKKKISQADGTLFMALEEDLEMIRMCISRAGCKAYVISQQAYNIKKKKKVKIKKSKFKI